MPEALDNATHALIGLMVAEAAILLLGRAGSAPGPAFRSAARWTSALGNNLGDLDFLYAQRLGGKLGYLLHHRGHTHTLLAALLIGLGLFGAWMVATKQRRAAFSRREVRTIFALCLIGPLLHIGMDFLNNYGVHPAWPLDDRWVYGDSLFIIEPWLWVVMVPPLVAAVSSRVLRVALASVLVAGLLLAWLLSIAPVGVALALTLGAAASVAFCRNASERARFNLAALGSLLVILGFAASSQLARAAVVEELRAASTGAGQAERTLDVVITPAPGNPLCFSAVTAHVAADRYVARAARVAALPGLVSAERCVIQATGLTLGLRAPTLTSSAAVFWEGEWQGSVSELSALSRRHCEVSAWLRFARIPFWRSHEHAGWLLGDLRFDRDPELDFDELAVAQSPERCPPWVPPWRPPRAELIAD